MTPPPTAASPPTPSPLAVATAAMAALAVAMGIGRFAFTPVLPMMLSDGSVSLAAGSWLATANYAGYLVGALFAMGTRYSAPAVVRFGLATIVVVTFAMALPLGLAGWMVLRFVAGVASAGVLVLGSAWTMARLGKRATPVLLATVFAGIGAGIVVAGALAVVLMMAAASAVQAWLILGLAAAGGTALAWPRFRASSAALDTSGAGRAPGHAQAAVTVRPPRSKRDRLALVFSYGTFGLGYIVPATFLPVMARDLVADPLVFGASWPVFGLAAIASTYLASAASARYGNRATWMVGQIAMAVGLLVVILIPSIIGIAVAATCVGGTFVLVTLVGVNEAHRLEGGAGQRLIGAMTVAFAIGQILGPMAAALALEVTGSLSPALAGAAGLLVIGAWLIRPRRAAGTGPTGAAR